MQLTFHGHACVTLSAGETHVLLDPGTHFDPSAALAEATVVLVTHEHGDHVDVPRVAEALHSRHGLQLWGTAAVVEALTAAGAPSDRLHEAVPGEVLELGDAKVTIGGSEHAVIHPALPLPANVTYLVEVDGVHAYHPGDSFAAPPVVPPTGLDVLLLPVAGPWFKISDAIDFLEAVPAAVVVPVHDAVLSEAGHALNARLLDTARLGGEYAYVRLAPGEVRELWAEPGEPAEASTDA